MAEPNRLRKENRPRLANQELRRVLLRAPLCVEANLAFAEMLSGHNQANFAQVHLQRAARSGTTPRIQMELAKNLRSQSRIEEAVAAYRKAVDMSPDSAEAWGGLISILETANRAPEAVEVLTDARRTLTTFPPTVRRPGAVAIAATKDYEKAIALLQGPDLIPMELLDRGRFKEKLQDYDGAWEDWTTAKNTLREKNGHVYWRDHFQAQWSALYEISQPARYKMMTPAPALDVIPGPVFVSGFPRSGTTMLETALSSHSRIVAGDELMGMNDVIQGLQRYLNAPVAYPQSLMATTLGDNAAGLALLRDLYWRKSQLRIGFPWSHANQKKTKAPAYFTDKMPLNQLHLPLLRLVLPEAPFIYARRHPLDIFVSHMAYFLPNGGHYASSLETLAEHYIGVDTLAQHYKAVLPMGPYLEVKYEDFVAGAPEQLARIFELLGLKLEPACIDFHENPRTARTISYSQVRTPLYDSSIGRYKNFRRHLAPVLKSIEAICNREGYEL